MKAVTSAIGNESNERQRAAKLGVHLLSSRAAEQPSNRVAGQLPSSRASSRASSRVAGAARATQRAASTIGGGGAVAAWWQRGGIKSFTTRTAGTA